MDRNDDMNLDELKDLLSDVPDDGGFDLESIIAEVEGRAPAAPTPEPEPEPTPAPSSDFDRPDVVEGS